jgi:hypothetical protein
MAYFKVGDTDFSNIVSGLKIGYETIVSDESGRNANGDTVMDIVNRKIKVYVELRHTTRAEMTKFLSTLGNYKVDVTFLNPKTNAMKTIRAYTGTPEPEYYTLSDKTLYKPMSINFIEL